MSAVHSVRPESVPLDQAVDRVLVRPLYSTLPKPSFDQSTRDGYAVCSLREIIQEQVTFHIVGEIAAGGSVDVRVNPGEAVRIMTGAPVPRGCNRVVPYEYCSEEGEQVVIPADLLRSGDDFIRRRGRDLEEGREIVQAGVRLQPDHLLMLAENNYTAVEVHRQPRVVVLCTGSELVEPGSPVRPGRKISGNGVLLQTLVQTAGGYCPAVETVPDNREEILACLEQLLRLKPDMVITTGGMGGGRFDLIEQIFVQAGGKLVYNRLQVRPGKSTLFGLLDGVLFFGLPGPPPAVRILFHELLAPTLMALQGAQVPFPDPVDGSLMEPVRAGRSSHLSLKGGVARFREGRLWVRPAGRLEPVTAILYLDGDSSFAAGDIIPVHLLGSFA